MAASLKGRKIPTGKRTYNSLLVRKTHDHRNSCEFSAWVIGVGKRAETYWAITCILWACFKTGERNLSSDLDVWHGNFRSAGFDGRREEIGSCEIAPGGSGQMDHSHWFSAGGVGQRTVQAGCAVGLCSNETLLRERATASRRTFHGRKGESI